MQTSRQALISTNLEAAFGAEFRNLKVVTGWGLPSCVPCLLWCSNGRVGASFKFLIGGRWRKNLRTLWAVTANLRARTIKPFLPRPLAFWLRNSFLFSVWSAQSGWHRQEAYIECVYALFLHGSSFHGPFACLAALADPFFCASSRSLCWTIVICFYRTSLHSLTAVWISINRPGRSADSVVAVLVFSPISRRGGRCRKWEV